MKAEKRILFACFTGAALGAVIALQFHYFWWAGILVGALAGYLLFSIKEVFQAIAIAWRNHVGGRLTARSIKAGTFSMAKVLGLLFGIVFCAASAVALAIGGLMFLVAPPESAGAWETTATTPETVPIPGIFWIISGAGMLLLATAILVAVLRAADRKRAVLGVLGCVAATPLFLPITLGVVFLTSVVPRGVRLFARFARHAFVLIHSEVRLLCMTDALLGALAGYFCGNALIGGAVGAALGWLNYRLVSVRWLKLVKA